MRLSEAGLISSGLLGGPSSCQLLPCPVQEAICLALLPRIQPPNSTAQGGDWQMHIGCSLPPSLLCTRRRVGVGVQKAADSRGRVRS